MIRKALALTLIATVSAGAVLGLRYRIRSGVGATREALVDARQTPGLNTVHWLGLGVSAAGYTLHSARAGRDGSRQLFYQQGKNVVSVFVSGKSVGVLMPSSEWRLVPLRPGQPAYIHTDAHGRTALAWRQNGRRCIATAGAGADPLLQMVRAITE